MHETPFQHQPMSLADGGGVGVMELLKLASSVATMARLAAAGWPALGPPQPQAVELSNISLQPKERSRHTSSVLSGAPRNVRRMLQPVQREPLQEPHGMPQATRKKFDVSFNYSAGNIQVFRTGLAKQLSQHRSRSDVTDVCGVCGSENSAAAAAATVASAACCTRLPSSYRPGVVCSKDMDAAASSCVRISGLMKQ
jgi:hypothetical protein